MKIQLNYAGPQNHTPRWVWVLLGISILVSSLLLWQYTRLRATSAGLELQVQKWASPTKQSSVNLMPSDLKARYAEQVRQANLVLAELGRPWARLLDVLEETRSPDVALLSIKPDAAKGRLRITAEARHLTDALEYVRSLSNSGTLTDVVLEGHEIVEADPDKPVHFLISARWGG